MILMTVKQALEDAQTSRAQGYDELAEEFEAIAEAIARYNELHSETVAEMQLRLGPERFAEAWAGALRRVPLDTADETEEGEWHG